MGWSRNSICTLTNMIAKSCESWPGPTTTILAIRLLHISTRINKGIAIFLLHGRDARVPTELPYCFKGVPISLTMMTTRRSWWTTSVVFGRMLKSTLLQLSPAKSVVTISVAVPMRTKVWKGDRVMIFILIKTQGQDTFVGNWLVHIMDPIEYWTLLLPMLSACDV